MPGTDEHLQNDVLMLKNRMITYVKLIRESGRGPDVGGRSKTTFICDDSTLRMRRIFRY